LIILSGRCLMIHSNSITGIKGKSNNLYPRYENDNQGKLMIDPIRNPRKSRFIE
jgi:hypothetical protein